MTLKLKHVRVPGWPLCSAGGATAFPYGGGLPLTPHHHHTYKHHGYGGRHAPYPPSYLPHRKHSTGNIQLRFIFKHSNMYVVYVIYVIIHKCLFQFVCLKVSKCCQIIGEAPPLAPPPLLLHWPHPPTLHWLATPRAHHRHLLLITQGEAPPTKPIECPHNIY